MSQYIHAKSREFYFETQLIYFLPIPIPDPAPTSAARIAAADTGVGALDGNDFAPLISWADEYSFVSRFDSALTPPPAGPGVASVDTVERR